MLDADIRRDGGWPNVSDGGPTPLKDPHQEDFNQQRRPFAALPSADKQVYLYSTVSSQ